MNHGQLDRLWLNSRSGEWAHRRLPLASGSSERHRRDILQLIGFDREERHAGLLVTVEGLRLDSHSSRQNGEGFLIAFHAQCEMIDGNGLPRKIHDFQIVYIDRRLADCFEIELGDILLDCPCNIVR